MLGAASLLELFSVLGERFPVHRWKVGDFHVWPLIRYDLFNWNFELLGRSSGTQGLEGSEWRALPRNTLRAVRASLQDHRQTSMLWQPASALLLSDGVSFVELDGQQYDRFCDPVRSLLEREGIATTFWTPHSLCPIPRASPSVFVQPAIDAARVLGLARSRLPVGAPCALEGFDEAMGAARREGAERIPTVKHLRRVVGYLDVYTRTWQLLLRHVRPKVAFLPCYIGAERQAFVAACWREGISSVDIQHGYAGRAHWAYSRGLGQVPEAGYELIPSHFWAWSKDDAAAVNEWAQPRSPHRAIAAGNAMQAAWLTGAVEAAEPCRARLRALLGDSRRRTVTFALSGFETSEMLDRLFTFCAAHRAETFCYFRTHPMRPAQQAVIEARIAREGLGAVADVREASRAPLYALLDISDVVALELSSSAFEADAQGVPVVLFGDQHRATYESLLKTGAATIATAETFATEVLRAAATGRRRTEATAAFADGIRAFIDLARHGASAR